MASGSQQMPVVSGEDIDSMKRMSVTGPSLQTIFCSFTIPEKVMLCLTNATLPLCFFFIRSLTNKE